MMAHSFHHAESSARRYGGTAADYIDIHSWFDASKAHFALPQHRVLRHHTAGIFEAEAIFGTTRTNSAGREIPVRFIGEQHVKEDCRCIPSVADWLAKTTTHPQDYWISEVQAGRTILGFRDWLREQQLLRETQTAS